MKKILFKLRMLYLRFSAGYPKSLREDQILKLGKKMWSNYCKANPTENNMDCLWNFQSYALKLDFRKLYGLQFFLNEHLKEVSSNFPEHDNATEAKLHQAYKEKIYAYKHAIC